MAKKFELITDSAIEVFGRKLFRIRALMAFGNVEKGEVGGYVEKEENLDHSGAAWVSGGACVSGDARVYGGACVYGAAWVSGAARVYGDARVSGGARVYGGACVYGAAWVYGAPRVYGGARVSGDARVYGGAEVKKPVLCISGAAQFTLTAYADLISIGCKLHNVKEWEKVFAHKHYLDEAKSPEAYEIYRTMFEFAREWLKGW